MCIRDSNHAAVDRVADDLARELMLWKNRDVVADVLQLEGATGQEMALVHQLDTQLQAWLRGLHFCGKVLDRSFTIKYRALLAQELASMQAAQPAHGEIPDHVFWIGAPPPPMDADVATMTEEKVCACLLTALECVPGCDQSDILRSMKS